MRSPSPGRNPEAPTQQARCDAASCAICVSGDSGVPTVIARPDSPAAVAFSAIAARLAAKVSVLNIGRQPGRTFHADPDLRVVK